MPLFGRDLMKAFNITWSQTNFVKGDYELSSLLNKYSELFDGGLGRRVIV